MDRLIAEYMSEAARGDGLVVGFTLSQALFSLVLSFALSALVGIVYRRTHLQVTYSQSFLHTMVLMGTVVSLVMLIIGSNIARAFALVGALSIIRFRSAVKDPKDVAYIFFAMAIGMACGTRFYLLATIGCFFICSVLYLLHWTNFGSVVDPVRILRVLVPADKDYGGMFDEAFAAHVEYHQLLEVDSARGGLFNRVTFLVKMKGADRERDFLEAIKRLNDNHDVTLAREDYRQNV